jgi:hypothetical protein
MFKNYLNIFLILISLVLLGKVVSVTDFSSASRYQPDFDAYYQLVADIRLGTNPYTVTHMQTLGPPLVFLYFYPFSLLSLHDAQSLNMLINLAAGYLCCAVLAVRFFKNHKLTLFLILSIIYYTSFISRYSLQIGQPNLLISLLIALVISTSKSQSYFLSALLALKTFFVLPILALVRTPSKFIRVSLFFLATLLISMAVIRPQWYADYSFRRAPEIDFFHTANYSDSLHYENQSFPAVLARLGLGQYLPVVYPLLIAAAIVVITLTQSLELGIIFSLLISPVLWQHYLIALFPVFIKSFAHTKSSLELFILAISLFLWFPDLRLWTEPVNLGYGFLASHFYLSLFLLALAQIPQLRYNSKRLLS